MFVKSKQILGRNGLSQLYKLQSTLFCYTCQNSVQNSVELKLRPV